MNLRRPNQARKQWLHHLPVIILLTIAFGVTRVVQAEVIDVPCNVTDLVNAIITANSNGEADTLNLAPGCTYRLTDTLDILPDGGNPLMIEGNGAILSGGFAVRVLLVENGAALHLNAVTVSNGTTTGSGGGIQNLGILELTNSTIVSNSADRNGGGINSRGPTLGIINTTISGNSAGDGGGGINSRGPTLDIRNSTLSGNSADNGGGIDISNAAMTISNSIISGNIASNNGGGIFTSATANTNITDSTLSGNMAVVNGGGILNSDATLTLTNSTVSGNFNNLADGGGIYTFGGTLTLNNSTISGNSAGTDGGGISGFRATLTLGNSILANSTGGGDCSNNAGTITSVGGNLVEDGSCGIPGALSGDPMLGGLTGSPAYLPLLPGSPAIDTGDNSICPAADQRGAARPFDGDENGTATCDLGSFELDTVTTPATPTPTSPYTATPTLAAQAATVPLPPPTPLCEDHNFAQGGVVRASTADALGYAIHCRVLHQNSAPTSWLGGDLYNAGSIGHQGVFDLGVIQAVDIFSPMGMTTFEGGGVFCLRGQGTLIWLAAKNAPRIAEIIGSYTVDDFPGFTCATLFEPGTLVLVRNDPR